MDLALGIILLILGALLASGVLPARRQAKTKKSAARGQPEKVSNDKEGRLVRVLRQPRIVFAFGIGILVGLPGAAYLTALHNLVAGRWTNATRVVGVLVFVIIELLLITVPWLLLEISPERTTAALRRTQTWLSGHVVQLTAAICLLLGAYLAISALVRLL